LRPNNYWEQADKNISNATSEMDYVDSIVNLNRAIDCRLKVLSKIYCFKNIPFINYKKNNLEALETLGIIRLTMIKKLNGLRNALEHRYENPPKQSRCLEFLDFVWYFLKSSDKLSRVVLTEFTLEYHPNPRPGPEYWFSISFDPTKKWIFDCGGWLPNHYVHKTKSSGIEIKVSKMNTTKELEKVRSAKKISKLNKYDIWGGEDKKQNDFCMEGEILGPPEHLNLLAKRYFNY
jgi:hypothetical protein